MNKKTLIFIGIFVLAVALLLSGMLLSQVKTPEGGNTEPPSTTTPTEPVPFGIPAGTYYYVMGTHTAHGEPDETLAEAVKFWPLFIFNDNSYIFNGNITQVAGTAQLNDNVVTFDKTEEIKAALPIDVEHDDMWHALYFPKQEREWKCTYDAETQTITIEHNSDFVQFKYFESPEECAQYLKENYSKDGYCEIYPEPHEIEIPEGVAGQN